MSISAEKFYGGSRYLAISAATVIHPRNARWWFVATTGTTAVTMPVVTRIPTGGITIAAINVGSNTFTVEDDNGATLATVPVGQGAILCLVDNSTDSGTWVVIMRTIGGGVGNVQRLQNVAVCGGTGTLTTHTRFDIPTVAWIAGTAVPDDHAEGAFMRVGPRANLVGNYALGAKSTYNHEMDEQGAWTTRAALTYQAGRTMGVGVKGRGILFGGDGIANVSEYVVDAWSPLAALPMSRSRGTAQAIGTKAFIFPGDPVDVPPIVYDQPADAYYTITADGRPARRSVGSFVINGRIYVVGGRHDSPVARYDYNDEYDPITNKWATRAAILAGSRYGGAGIGGNDTGGYFGGRNAADAATNDSALYISDTWTIIPSLPANRAEIENQGTAL